MKRILDLDLLTPRNIEVRMPDKDTIMNGLFVVDDLKGLNPDALKAG